MTTSAPIPAVDAAPSMANPSDTASKVPPAQARAATVARPSLRAQVAENPLLSFFGLVIVALLAAAVASPNIRISDTNGRIDGLEVKMDARFSDTNGRIDRLEVKMDARFSDTNGRIDRLEAKMDARFSALETAVGEIDRKLTALIAHLNAASEVDNALTGRLTGEDPPDAAG